MDNKTPVLLSGVELNADQVRQIRQAAESQGIPLEISTVDRYRAGVIGSPRLFIDDVEIDGRITELKVGEEVVYTGPADDIEAMRAALTTPRDLAEVTSIVNERARLMRLAATPEGAAQIKEEVARRMKRETKMSELSILAGMRPEGPTESRKDRRARARMIDKQLRKARAR